MVSVAIVRVCTEYVYARCLDIEAGEEKIFQLLYRLQPWDHWGCCLIAEATDGPKPNKSTSAAYDPRKTSRLLLLNDLAVLHCVAA